MRGADSTSDDVTLPPESGSAPVRQGEEPVVRGSTVGRYVVLSELGRGGMGAVYEAFDPDLQRVVALKLLQRGHSATEGKLAPEAARMLQEARAMAKLRHPNVITVYDVGLLDGAVFVAMELIRGRTLRAWVEETSPSPTAILGAFVAAGSGLAAAHEAGVVHRDFKPDNVLVDDEGRVVVLDFGLAAQVDIPVEFAAAQSLGSGAFDASLDVGASGQSMTATGSVMGTPAYMAPEQFRGRTTDPRSDQFAFCVALYEALVGKRPFSAETVAELSAKICRGEQDALPSTAQVPTWITTRLQRGLSRKPEDRWPDMRALLRELSVDPTRRRRRLGLGAGLALLAAAAGGYSVLEERARVAACDHNEGELAGIWEPSERGAARARFDEVAGEFGEETFARADRVMLEQREAWLAAQSQLCRTRPVDAEPRLLCLDLARADLATRSRVFVDASRPMVELAVHFAGLDNDPIACLEHSDLGTRFPSPPADDERTHVASIRRDLVEARAFREAGLLAPAGERVERALQDAELLGYLPLVAEGQLEEALQQRERGQLEEAEAGLWLAMATASGPEGHPRVVVQAWVSLLYLVGRLQARSAEALQWVPLVESLVHALDDASMTRRFEGNVGAILLGHGELDLAEARFRRALESAVLAYGEGSLPTTNLLNNLGTVHGSRGDLETASEYFERVRSIRSSQLGPDHPDVANALTNLAFVKGNSDPAEAERLASEALSIKERGLPPGHVDIANGLQLLAAIQFERGEYEQAAASAERSVALLRALHSGPHPDTERALSVFALSLGSLRRRPKEAVAAAEEVVESRRTRLGRHDAQVASVVEKLMIVASQSGAYTTSLKASEDLTQLVETLSLGPRPQALAVAYRAVAMSHLGDEDRGTMLARQGLETPELGDDADEVARVLVDSGIEALVAIGTAANE